MQPYFDPTRKTTFKKNGRQPQTIQKFKKMKTTSKKMEDNLQKKKNGRQI
jgi:hypothetical protein